MIVYISLVLIITVWLILLCLPSIFHLFGAEQISGWYYAAFKLLCHQQPERSYFILGKQMTVCARCLGVYLGVLVGLVIYPFSKSLNNTKLPPIRMLAWFFMPIIIDGLFQSFHVYNSGNYIRTATGLIATAPLAFYAVPLINQIVLRIKEDL